MTRRLKPWNYAPFEVLLHAEMHYRIGEDFDRRIAMIGFDNAIEFNIAYYLNLKPIHRGGRSYNGDNVLNWLASYQSRIEFFYTECQTRGVVVAEQMDEVIWCTTSATSSTTAADRPCRN
ncbi:MAG TPA: hypothetical protein VMF91_19910 [Bryobacteraceae bacterium]|nr:hypothetical protein [Bryobacteraceae bacterium]